MAKHVSVGKPVNDAEKWAFKYLKENLPKHYVLITNVEVYTDNNQPFECDAIIVGDFAVYVIDVKGYQGRLNANKDVWQHDGRNVQNPLPKLNQNARILASRCKRRLRYNQHAPWCQGVVFITGGIGGEIVITSTGDYSLPVFSPKKIIQALTTQEYITAYHKYKLEKYQIEIALGAICDFKLLDQKQQKVANYKKLKKISDKNDVELWLVEPEGHTFKFKYWMKYIDISGKNIESIEKLKAQLKKEYYLLSELSDLPSVPAVLTYHDDGESIALVHQGITGKPLKEITSFDVVDVMISVITSLIEMNRNGISHRALSLETIYLGDDDKIQLLDVGYARSRETVTIVSPSQLDNPWLPPEYIDEGTYSTQSSSFQFAAVFLPLLAESLPESVSTLDFIAENYKFSLKNEFQALQGVEEWFRQALSTDMEDRPELDELLICLSPTAESVSQVVGSFELAAGVIIDDKYRLEECIGHGGTSTIWKAEHLLGEYPCCLKVVGLFDGSDEIAKKEFEILRTMYHPNIVRIFDLDIIPETNHYFLTSEYLDGCTLDQTESISIEESIEHFRQILTALQYIHRLGRIHKDIKPENIMIIDKKACLIDFNISSLDSLLLGTTRYKDPAVIENGWKSFSDIYSLVISFSEVLLGMHPFESNDGIPSLHLAPEIKDNAENIPASLKSKFKQVLERQVEWRGVKDYVSWFGIASKVDIVLPEALKKEWKINDGYMSKVLRVILADMQPRSRAIIKMNALKSHGIPGNKSNKGSANAAISALKRENIIEEYGKKIKLTDSFKKAWESIKD